MPIQCVRPTAEIFYGLSLFTFALNTITLPQLIQHKVCYNEYNSTVCENLKHHHSIENYVQARAASWMSIIPLSALLPGMFIILMIGPISDVIGKKRTMMLPPAVYFIQSLVFILLTRIAVKFSPGFFLFAYCLSGLFGDNAGCGLLAEAYIACITTKENRTVRLAMLESSVFIGQLTAAISSGFILSTFGFTGAFTATAVVNFINAIYVVVLLPPESGLTPRINSEQSPATGSNDLSTENEGDGSRGYQSARNRDQTVVSRKTLREISPLACLQRIKEAICARQRRNRMAALLVLFSIAMFINMGEIYLGVLFVKHSPFNLDAKGIGYLIALQAFVRSIGLIVLPYFLQLVFKFKDIHFVMLGFATQFTYFLTLAFSVSSTMLYLVQLISTPMIVHFPAVRSMISKLVDVDQYGSAIAVTEAVGVAGSLLTSLLSNQIYSKTVGIFTGFTVVLLGLLAVPGLIGAIVYSYVYKHSDVLNEEQRLLLTSNEGGSSSDRAMAEDSP